MATFLKDSIRPIILKMIKESWEVREGEKILIVTDFPSSKDLVEKSTKILEPILERNILAKNIHEIISELHGENVELYIIPPAYEHYKDPEDPILKEKINKSDIVFTLTEFSLTDVPTLYEPLQAKKIRHVSAPLVPPDVFHPGGPMDVNFYEIEELTTQLYSLVNGAKTIEIFDVAGSHLTITFNEPKNWLFESGFVTEGGMFTNIPSGEITLELPYEQDFCSISGSLNIFPGWQDDLTQPLALHFDNSRLVDVAGGGPAGEVLQEMINNDRVNIVQFGIGTNPKAKDPLCATVADKFSGVAHIRFFPDTDVDHYYFPISRMKINEKEYSRTQLFKLKE